MRLAELISQRLTIPSIGIGAGAGCDGQVLVTHDLLGFFDRFTPRFVKRYANLFEELQRAFVAYKTDIQERQFPSAEHTFSIKDEEWQTFLTELGEVR
jgi:3-methyl-2-oxobutanoate hydroxymethyltransferase